MPTELTRFLVKAALDGAFRRQAQTDPDAAFGDFELTEAERTLLRRQDLDLLHLLGHALTRDEAFTQLPPSTLEPRRVRPTALPSPWGHRHGPAVDAAAEAARADASQLPALLEALTGPGDRIPRAPLPPKRGQPADITILGLGILNADHLTRQAEAAIAAATEVLYVDHGIATGPLIEALGSRATPLAGESYTEAGPRLDAYGHMARRTLQAALDHAPVVFAMQGHPIVFSYVPFLLRDAASVLGLTVSVLPGISAADCLFAELMVDPCAHGLQMYEATDILLRDRPLQPDVPLLIWQVGNLETRLHTTAVSRPERFARFRAHLLRFYPASHPVVAVFSASHPLMPSEFIEFRLGEIASMAHRLHPGVTLFVPAVRTPPVADTDLLAQLDDPEHVKQLTRS